MGLAGGGRCLGLGRGGSVGLVFGLHARGGALTSGPSGCVPRHFGRGQSHHGVPVVICLLGIWSRTMATHGVAIEFVHWARGLDLVLLS